MEEFIAVFEQTSGQSLAWWREQWLERRGVPAITFESSVSFSGNRYRITCKLVQDAEFISESPLEIGIRTADTDRIEKFVLRDRTTELIFYSSEQPREVILDPNNRILMKKIQK